MRLSQIGAIILLSLLLVTGFQNCGSTDNKIGAGNFADTNNKEPGFEQSYKSLEDLVAADLSCTQSSDCIAVPIGSKACGGPTGYLVASKLNPNFNEIAALAARLAELEKQYNLRSGLVSDCMYLMPPNVECVQAICGKK